MGDLLVWFFLIDWLYCSKYAFLVQAIGIVNELYNVHESTLLVRCLISYKMVTKVSWRTDRPTVTNVSYQIHSTIAIQLDISVLRKEHFKRSKPSVTIKTIANLLRISRKGWLRVGSGMFCILGWVAVVLVRSMSNCLTIHSFIAGSVFPLNSYRSPVKVPFPSSPIESRKLFLSNAEIHF